VPRAFRVFLVGATAGDLELLRACSAAAPGLEIAGAATLHDVHDDGLRLPSTADAVLLSPAAWVAASAVFPPLPSGVPSDAGPAGEEAALVEVLTARERDVLALVAEGRPNRDIAARLGISEHTVKFHLASIFGKLAVSTRTQAVRRALEWGLIEI
jgi:DNA-binding CsgD family transcriptional regulator